MEKHSKPNAGAAQSGAVMKRRCIPRFVGIIGAVSGLLLMLLGIYRNEIEIMFTKAINICLECIGIG